MTPSESPPPADASPLPRAGEWRPSVNPWLIAFAVMLPTFMEVLDTTVVTVSLPHIGGNLAATSEEATWVLTSYLISNAIILPAAAWLGSLFGRRRFLLACIGIFTVASAACGAAGSLGGVIAARVLQGVGGGALQPTAQAVLLESFPPARRGVAMAAFSMGVIVAPILGPTLGGWITDNYSWRWIFYINLPIGVLAMLMTYSFVEEPPYLARGTRRALDYSGFLLLALWLGTAQVVLDKGQQDDWFAAVWIRWFVAISLVAMIAFVTRELRTADPIVDLRILANRNFAAGVAGQWLLGFLLYATTSQLPLFLQTLLGYPALQSGLTVSPRGLGAMVSAFVIGRLIGIVDARIMLVTGFLFLAGSSFMYAHLSLDITMRNVVWASIMNGAATGMIFVPLSTMALARLPVQQMGNAAGIYNLMRNLGGSVGISIVTTLLQRGAQAHQTALVSHLTPYDPGYQSWLDRTGGALAPKSGTDAPQQAMGLLYGLVHQQALLLAFVDNFRLVGFLSIASVSLALLFSRAPRARPVAGAH